MKGKAHKIPEWKSKAVKELVDLIENKKTILVSSIKDLPASQFQEIGKKLRGKAIVKVPKKNLLFRAIDESKDENVKKLKEHYTNSIALLFSDLDSFDLSADLLKSKTPAKAKPGQEAPMDIEIPAGPTDLAPGPAISELGAVGLKVQIEKGKITIAEPKVIVEKGKAISPAAADIMAKLDIKPFSIGFVPLLALDKTSGKLYLNININPEEAINQLKEAFGRALPFAVNIGYPNEETIKLMIGKAGMHEKALASLVNAGAVEEEKPAEEKKEETATESKPEESPSEEKEEVAETQTPENKTEGEENK